MKQKLIAKAQELRQHGFTTGEIADELNVSMDTARWLTLQKATEEKTDAPVDFAINWKSIGGNSTRLSYVSGALSDMALSHGDVDTIVGVAVSGIPFATVMADLMEDMSGEDTSLAIFHPHKHRKDADESDDEGTISTNFGSVEGKKVVIVDDVITSGKTAKEVIHTVKDLGGEPTCVVVLIDKAGLSEIEGVLLLKEENIMKDVLITVTGLSFRYGSDFLKKGMKVKLVKEPDNEYDNEAIRVELKGLGHIGYVANSVHSVIKGCMSSGRVYDKIDDEYFAKIKFITGNMAIAKVLSSDEFIEEIENPESDVHYLSDDKKLDMENVKQH